MERAHPQGRTEVNPSGRAGCQAQNSKRRAAWIIDDSKLKRTDRGLSLMKGTRSSVLRLDAINPARAPKGAFQCPLPQRIEIADDLETRSASNHQCGTG